MRFSCLLLEVLPWEHGQASTSPIPYITSLPLHLPFFPLGMENPPPPATKDSMLISHPRRGPGVILPFPAQCPFHWTDIHSCPFYGMKPCSLIGCTEWALRAVRQTPFLHFFSRLSFPGYTSDPHGEIEGRTEVMAGVGTFLSVSNLWKSLPTCCVVCICHLF